MDKKEKYELIVSQIEGLVSGESDIIANMANISAVLHHGMGFWWTGFYIVKNKEQGAKIEDNYSDYELVLGPFQGPVACTRIGYGRGVCGTSWKRKETIIVPDVEQFAGHIACSSESRSEIVVPLIKDSKVTAVLDIDSRELNTFDEIDKIYLEKIVDLI